MKRFLYFKTKTYKSSDYNNYLNGLDREEGEDGFDESELWKESLDGEKPKVELPKAYPARVAIDPDLILAYVETSSIEEYANNPENPKFDCIDIILADKVQITVIGTIEEFERQLLALNR